jgi:hypothetical protein
MLHEVAEEYRDHIVATMAMIGLKHNQVRVCTVAQQFVYRFEKINKKSQRILFSGS